jgi:hypothetical protein
MDSAINSIFSVGKSKAFIKDKLYFLDMSQRNDSSSDGAIEQLPPDARQMAEQQMQSRWREILELLLRVLENPPVANHYYLLYHLLYCSTLYSALFEPLSGC